MSPLGRVVGSLPKPVTALTLIVAASAAARSLAALTIPAPLFFPDEWLYAAISRSVFHGRFGVVHGVRVPLTTTISYLGPILTSPLWLLGSVADAYHLSQVLASIAFASSAPLAYALARRLQVGHRGSLAVAVLSQVVPCGAYTATLLAEPYAYPLFLACALLGLDAIADTTGPRVLAAAAATAALFLAGGLQFFVVPLALLMTWVSSAYGVRPALRRAAAVAVVGSLVGILASLSLPGGSVADRIANVIQAQHFPAGEVLAWLAVNAFVLAVASGWMILPLAVVELGALSRGANPRARAFAHLTVLLTIGLLLEAAVWGANANGVYERFTFYASPLLAVAFAHGAGRSRSTRAPLAIVGYGLAAAAIVAPLADRLTENLGHSPTALALREGMLVGTASPPLVWVPLLVIVAVAAATGLNRPLATSSVAAAIAGIVAVSGFRNLDRRHDVVIPHGPPARRAALLVTAAGERGSVAALQTLFWNPDATRLLVLGGTTAPDGLPPTIARLTPRGVVAGGRLESPPFVVQDDTAVWGAATTRARSGIGTVHETPQALAFGWFGSGRLAPVGQLVAVAEPYRAREVRIRLRRARAGLVELRLRCGSLALSRHARLEAQATDLVFRIPAGRRADCAWTLTGADDVRASLAFAPVFAGG